MVDNKTQPSKRQKESKQTFDKNPSDPLDNPGDNPKGVVKESATVALQTPPTRPVIARKGQKYVAPPGRHSQQTHQRAEARAAEQGHATEQEQHAHDRGVLTAGLNQRAAQQRRQQESKQNAQNARQKENAPESPQEDKQK